MQTRTPMEQLDDCHVHMLSLSRLLSDRRVTLAANNPLAGEWADWLGLPGDGADERAGRVMASSLARAWDACMTPEARALVTDADVADPRSGVMSVFDAEGEGAHAEGKAAAYLRLGRRFDPVRTGVTADIVKGIDAMRATSVAIIDRAIERAGADAPGADGLASMRDALSHGTHGAFADALAHVGGCLSGHPELASLDGAVAEGPEWERFLDHQDAVSVWPEQRARLDATLALMGRDVPIPDAPAEEDEDDGLEPIV